MEKEERLLLSVVDVEKKYTIDPAETVYGGGTAIVSWGRDNDLPKLLTTCYEKSATLKAAIDMSINYVDGDEVIVTDEAAAWKEKVNRRGQDMQTLISHITYDYYVTGCFAIQIIYNAFGPCELYPLDVTRCRLNEARDRVFYSKKGWTKYSTKSDEYRRFGFAEYDPKNPTMIYFYNGAGVKRTYNPAPWGAALDDVLTEIEASRYCLNTTTNGFAARYLINLPDTANLDNEQKKAIEDGIRTKFCGYDAESNFMIYYANDEGKSLTVNKIEADESPERLQTIRDGARTNIFTSLRISPLLCGVSVGTSTGFATQEFSDSFKLFDRTVAAPVRKVITTAVNDCIGVQDGVVIKPFTISFSNEG